MNARKNFTLIGLLIVTALAVTAQSADSLTYNMGNTAFTIDVPVGWRAVALDANSRPRNAAPLGDLIPAAPNEQVNGVLNAFYIRVVCYENRTPIAARTRWEQRRAAETSTPIGKEISRIDGLPTWSLVEAEGATLTAYTQLGEDVVVIELNAQGSGKYEDGKRVLLGVLKSYRESRSPR